MGEPPAPTSASGSEGGEVSTSTRGPSYRSAAVVGALTLLSRVTGLLREATRAHFLGAGLVADAFHVAFMLPSLFRRLVGEGAVSSALVPVFSRVARREGRGGEKGFAERFLTLWLFLVTSVTLAGVLLGARFVALAFRWGSFAEGEKVLLTGRLTSFLFWYLLFVGMSAALQGILNARAFFAVPSASPLVFNLAFVGCAWFAAPWMAAEPEERVWVLAAGVLVGGVLQLLLMVPLVWRLGIRPRFRWPFDHPGVRRVMRLFVPAVFGAGIYQVNVLINTVLAGRLDVSGAVAVLGYSNRLMEVVLGVFVFSLSTVSLTSLSRQIAEDDVAGYSRTLCEVLRLVVFITLPSMVGLYVLRRPVISLLLESGAFGRESLEMTAAAFRYHVLGVCFVGINRVLVNGFYALQDVTAPVRIAGVNLFFNLGLAWALSASALSYAGIALASSLAASIQTAMLWYGLRVKVARLSLADLWPTTWKTILASGVMALVVELVSRSAPEVEGKLSLGLWLGVEIICGAAVFFVVARLLGAREARFLLGRGGKAG